MKSQIPSKAVLRLKNVHKSETFHTLALEFMTLASYHCSLTNLVPFKVFPLVVANYKFISL